MIAALALTARLHALEQDPDGTGMPPEEIVTSFVVMTVSLLLAVATVYLCPAVRWLHHVASAALFTSAFVVIAMLLRSELPMSLWCSTMLAAQFFAVHAQQWVSDLLTAQRHEEEGIPAELHAKGHGARLRALELSAWRGDPQAWMQTAFQVSTHAVM